MASAPRRRSATPPTTPPAIAPTGADDVLFCALRRVPVDEGAEELVDEDAAGTVVNEVMVVPPCTMRVAEVEDTAGGVVGTVGAAVVGAVVGVGAAVVGQGEKYVDTGDATNAGLMDRDVTLAVVVSVAPVRTSTRVTRCPPTVSTSVLVKTTPLSTTTYVVEPNEVIVLKVVKVVNCVDVGLGTHAMLAREEGKGAEARCGWNECGWCAGAASGVSERG